MQSNLGKYKDSTPEIPPAGKLFEQGGTAKECIHGRGAEVCKITFLICKKAVVLGQCFSTFIVLRPTSESHKFLQPT